MIHLVNMTQIGNTEVSQIIFEDIERCFGKKSLKCFIGQERALKGYDLSLSG